MTPIGPAPVTRTSSPTIGHCRAVCVALPNGSKMAPRSGSIDVRLHPRVGRRHARHSPRTRRPVDPDADRVDAHVAAAGSTVAAVPAHDVALAGHSRTALTGPLRDVLADLDDLAVELVPDHHRRRTVAAAQSSHCSRCRSVPHRPARKTRTFTSSGPHTGSGRSTSSSPGPAVSLVKARTEDPSRRQRRYAGSPGEAARHTGIYSDHPPGMLPNVILAGITPCLQRAGRRLRQCPDRGCPGPSSVCRVPAAARRTAARRRGGTRSTSSRELG
jgi:hypothetical protein